MVPFPTRPERRILLLNPQPSCAQYNRVWLFVAVYCHDLSPNKSFSDLDERHGKSFPFARGGLCKVGFENHHPERHGWISWALCVWWNHRFQGVSAAFPKASQARGTDSDCWTSLYSSTPNCWVATTQYSHHPQGDWRYFTDFMKTMRSLRKELPEITEKQLITCIALLKRARRASAFEVTVAVMSSASLGGCSPSQDKACPCWSPGWSHTNFTCSETGRVALVYLRAMSPEEKSDGCKPHAKTSPHCTLPARQHFLPRTSGVPSLASPPPITQSLEACCRAAASARGHLGPFVIILVICGSTPQTPEPSKCNCNNSNT